MRSTWPSYEEIVRSSGAPVVAVVFGVGQFQGLAVLRGLGRMGVPVCAIGEDRSVGFRSRFACERLVSPDPHRDPEGLMRLLLALGRRLKAEGKRGVLFPTRDRVVELIAQRQTELGEFFICHTPDYDVIRRCSDKETQIQLARELSVPIPRTYFDTELDLLFRELDSGQLSFPLIFKAKRELPSEQKRRFRLIIIPDRGRLQEALSSAKEHHIAFLIQEVIPGEDDSLYTLGSCRSRQGELKAVFTGRKLRQRPPRFGECRVGESVYVEPIIRDGERILQQLGFFGISQVEFKFDLRDGRYKLIEVNPRSWSWISLPIAMGINIPYAFLLDACSIEVPAQPMIDQRAVYISLWDDLYWSLKRRDGLPWIHCFRRYEKIVEPFFSFEDPLPGLLHFQRAGVGLLGSLGKALLRSCSRALRAERGPSAGRLGSGSGGSRT